MDRLLAPAQSRRSVTTPIVNGLDKPLGVKGCVSWVGLKKWRLPRLPPLDPWVNLWWITRNPYYKWTMEVGIPWYTGIPHHWGWWLLSASVSLLHPAGRGGLLLRPASQQDRVPLKMVLDGARTTFCMGKICAVFDCEHILISYYLSFFLLSNKRLFDCSIIQQIPEFDTEVWRLCGSIKLWVDARFWSFQVPHVLSKYRQLLCKSEQHHWHFVSFVINCYCMYSHCRASCGQADVTFSMHIPHFQQDCSIRFCHSPTKPWSYF